MKYCLGACTFTFACSNDHEQEVTVYQLPVLAIISLYSIYVQNRQNVWFNFRRFFASLIISLLVVPTDAVFLSFF